MFNNFFSNLSNMIDMLLAAVISVFFTLIFKGGPSILYEEGEFNFKKLMWLFLLQFFGSIGVYILTSYFFCSGFLTDYKSSQQFFAFLAALMPVEITLVLLIALIYRIWIFAIKKVDPNFKEDNPLDNIHTISKLSEFKKHKSLTDLENKQQKDGNEEDIDEK